METYKNSYKFYMFIDTYRILKDTDNRDRELGEWERKFYG